MAACEIPWVLLPVYVVGSLVSDGRGKALGWDGIASLTTTSHVLSTRVDAALCRCRCHCSLQARALLHLMLSPSQDRG